MESESPSFTENYSIDVRNLVSYISSSLSIIGGIFIFTVYMMLKELRTKTLYKLVFNLTVSSLIATLAGVYLPSNVEENSEMATYCQLAGFFLEYGTLSTLLWSAAFAWKIYTLVVHAESLENTVKLGPTYLLCFVLPFTFCLGVQSIAYWNNTKFFGFNPTYCWLIDGPNQIHYILPTIGLFFPAFFVIIFTFVLYIRIRRKLRSLGLEVKWPFHFLLYPLLIFIFIIPAILDQGILLIYGGNGNAILHYIFTRF
jgi:hypothetical protein